MYSGKELLDRLYTELANRTNGAVMTIPKPEVSSANKKSFIANFRTICNKLNRPEQEVKKYFIDELKTDISISQSGALIITGRYELRQITKMFSNYIKEYITCKECSSCNTEIIKENRITFIVCKKCLAKKAL